jgi:RimJ/RimL family protein N-acetyltransferase
MGMIDGDRVYLRPIERADIDRGWLKWVNDHSLNQFLVGSFPVNRDALEQYYESSQPPGTAMFAICLKDNDTYIGNGRLSEIDWVHRSCKYGRLIGDSQYRARGYGSEALVLLLRYGFHHLGMNRIFSAALSNNKASITSNEKTGMKREGIMRQALYKGGRFHDLVMLAMLRSDFDELHGNSAQ